MRRQVECQVEQLRATVIGGRHIVLRHAAEIQHDIAIADEYTFRHARAAGGEQQIGAVFFPAQDQMSTSAARQISTTHDQAAIAKDGATRGAETVTRGDQAIRGLRGQAKKFPL